jgi:hypothetical protein
LGAKKILFDLICVVFLFFPPTVIHQILVLSYFPEGGQLWEYTEADSSALKDILASGVDK